MKYNYNFIPVQPSEIIQIDSFSSADSELLQDFKVNSTFNQFSNFIELHYYTLDGRLLKSINNYTNFRSNQDSESTLNNSLSTLTLRTEDDVKLGGYEAGDVYLYYNFLNDYYTQDNSKLKFFIEEISPDRKELRLVTTKANKESVESSTAEIKTSLSESDAETFYLNLGKNRLLLCTNIDTLDYKEDTSVVVKLYNQLPSDISIKQQLSINSQVNDSIAYKVDSEIVITKPKVKYLKGPNFNIQEGKGTSSPTQYLSINEAFSYPVTNSYYEVKSLFEEKGASLSIDHTDYNSFINFSSAEERLRNFKYKLDLINSYQSSSNNIRLAGTYSTASVEHYDNLTNTILSNFDHYDRFLYYESSSYSWPKTGTDKPYTPVIGSATGSWYNSQLISASDFDNTNPNQLLNTVPEFLREDPSNVKYTTFIHMVAQHFDNLWIYAKNVTDKYNSDNRLDFGISKDLIDDALKNFGVKLYNSNRSTQELFEMFTGQAYLTGSEGNSSTLPIQVVSGSNTVTSQENYRKQIYKRVYHNLPLLLKSKGTDRGVRALLSTFGIPSFYSSGSHSGIDVLQLGGSLSGSYNLGPLQYTTSSLGKIRISDTGSIEGSTLSRYVNITQDSDKYSKNLNTIQVGFSPTDELNSIIITSSSAASFDIDSILGDPGYAYSSSYKPLIDKAEEYLPISVTNLDKYDLNGFSRLLKYYDNLLFKTVVDFLPARSNVNTGLVIKPHLLERNKIKQVEPTTERHNEFSQSISIQTTSGSEGGTFGGRNQYSSSYTEFYMTSGGFAASSLHSHEQAKYDGEFSGSKIEISNGELNINNSFKYVSAIENIVDIAYVSSSAVAPTPTPTPTNTVTPTPTPTEQPPVSSTPTPTPTNTPTPSTAGTFNLRIRVYTDIGVQENNTDIEYKVTASPSSSPFDTSIQTGDLAGSFVNLNLYNVSGNDDVVVNVLRVEPNGSAIAVGSIEWGNYDVTHLDVSPTSDIFSSNDNINKNYTLSNFDHSLSIIPIDLTITEGS